MSIIKTVEMKKLNATAVLILVLSEGRIPAVQEAAEFQVPELPLSEFRWKIFG